MQRLWPRLPFFIATVAVGLFVTAGPARAGDELRTMIVVGMQLESGDTELTLSTAQRLGKRVSATLDKELRTLTPEETHARVSRRMVTPLRRANAEKLREIEKQIAQGDELVYTDPRAAIPILAQAKAELEGIMESITLDTKVREELFRTQMLLARSHLDYGDRESAQQVLEELIREFGVSDEVTDARYHPRLVELYERTVTLLARERTASLRVTTDPPGLEVMLNGQTQPGRSPTLIHRLLPGTYHVQVRGGDLPESMLHVVELAPKKRSELTIDLRFDAALRVTQRGAGLRFRDEAALGEHATDYAVRLAKLVDAKEILLVGQVAAETGEGTDLLAVRVDASDGSIMRRVRFQINAEAGPTVDQLDHASDRLCGLVAATTPAPPPGASPAGGGEWYTDWLGWTLVGAGVASAGVASYFLVDYMDKRDCAGDLTCGDLGYRERQADAALDSRTTAAVLYGVGGAAIVGGVLVFILRDRGPDDPTQSAFGDIPRITPFTLPDGGGVFVHGDF